MMSHFPFLLPSTIHLTDGAVGRDTGTGTGTGDRRA